MVYLIHFSKPFKHARHYIGYSESMETFKNRLHHHRNNTGSKLLKAVNKAGINWRVIRIWQDKDYLFEQKIKRCGNSSNYCPVCRKRRNAKRRLKNSLRK